MSGNRQQKDGWHRRAVWVRKEDLEKFNDWLLRAGVCSLQELVDLGIAGTPERAGRREVRLALKALQDEQRQRF